MQRRLIVGLAVVVAMVAGACSKSSTTPEASPASQGGISTEAPAVGAVTYAATEFSFDGPDTLPAGTSDITVENIGTVDHEMTIVRLDKHQDWTEEQIVAFINDDPTAEPSWAPPVAGLLTESGPPVIAPGESAPVVFLDFSNPRKPVAVEDGALAPGTYLFLCFQGDAPFHAGMGMVKKVTVT